MGVCLVLQYVGPLYLVSVLLRFVRSNRSSIKFNTKTLQRQRMKKVIIFLGDAVRSRHEQKKKKTLPLGPSKNRPNTTR